MSGYKLLALASFQHHGVNSCYDAVQWYYVEQQEYEISKNL